MWRTRERAVPLAVFLAALILFLAAAPVSVSAAERRFIGDEPADDNCWTGDVATERETERMFIPELFSMTTGFVGGVAATSGAGLSVAGGLLAASGASKALADLSDHQKVPWKNWPHSRYLFWHYPPDKVLGVLPSTSAFTLAVLEFLANGAFSVTKMLVLVSINVIAYAFCSSEWVAQGADWIASLVRDMFSFSSDQSFMRILLMLCIVGLAAALLKRILKAQVASTVVALGIAVVAVASTFGYITYAGDVIRGLMSFTDGLSGLTLSTTSRFLMDQRYADRFSTDLARGIASAGQAAWEAMVADPWAAAMFGTTNPENLRVTKPEWDAMNRGVFPDDVQKELGNRVDNGTLYADTLFLGCGDDKSRDAVTEALGRPSKWKWSFLGLINVGETKVDHGRHPATEVTLMPSIPSVANHLITALLTLIPAFTFAALAFIVGGSMIVASCFLVLFFIFLPLGLVAAVVPDAGWSAASKYVHMLLSMLAIKVFYGLYLGAVLALGTGLVRGLLH